MKILIIEDDAILAQILKETLHFNGTNFIHVAGTLAEALLVNSTFKAELIILDLMLPDATPEQSTNAIPELIGAAESNSDAALLVFSGRVTDDIRKRALELGAKVVTEKKASSTDRQILEAASEAVRCKGGDCATFLAHAMAIMTNTPTNA